MATPPDSPLKYIKLGKKGVWEKECIEHSNTLRLGFVQTDHNQCLRRDWDAVYKGWYKRTSARVATSYTNQIRTFYETGEETLWITFFRRRMWWCRSSAKKISLLSSGDKERKVDGKWSCESITGKTLNFSRLRKGLVRTRLFKGTICNVADSSYVLNMIFGPDYPIAEEIPNPETYLEGALQTVIVNKYERSREARLRCIEEHGYECAVCGCSMKDLYGKVADGLIHVHHLRELSSIKQAYELDPIEHLRPVCPNCHAVLHTQIPMLSIDELRAILARRARIKWPRR
jgi:hypothetical protein